MGNNPEKQKNASRKNSRTSKKANKNKVNDAGEDFFLEDWEVMKNENPKIDDYVKFDTDLLISEVKKDPHCDYKEIKILGEGSFGKVSLVKHKVTGIVRAMKSIKKLTFKKNNDLTILNEINILKKIDHPNIVKIYEFFITDDFYYILMEYCEGGELLDLINESDFTEIQAAFIMYQIFSAINYCHKIKIIHRDIKPENILINKNENGLYRVKICDFGTSQIFHKGEIQDKVVGSLYYIAPDVLQKNYNFKCDLWSCGVIMFILLTGKIPFDGPTHNIIYKNILNSDYNKQYLEKCSKPAIDLIAELLEKDPKKRINAEDALNHKFFFIYKTKESLNNISDEKIRNYLNHLKKYKCKSILQETALAYLIHNFSDTEEVTDACKLFNKIDMRGRGKISLDDFNVGLSILLNSDKMRNDVEEIFENLDIDKDNYIGYQEFVRASVDMRFFLTDDILNFVFQYFDKDKTGEITAKQISEIYSKNVNKQDVDKALDKIIKEVDSDGDGKIKYEEFCKLMVNIAE